MPRGDATLESDPGSVQGRGAQGGPTRPGPVRDTESRLAVGKPQLGGALCLARPLLPLRGPFPPQVSLSKGRRSAQRGQGSHWLPPRVRLRMGNMAWSLRPTSVPETRLSRCLEHGVPNPGFSLGYAGSELNQEIHPHKLLWLFSEKRKLSHAGKELTVLSSQKRGHYSCEYC